MASEGKYDFVKMSQQPATQENLTRFLKAGEALMWPSNWEQYPNKAGKIAKAATVDVRDQYLATRKAGVYVTGSGHLKAVENITGKQGVAEGSDSNLSYQGNCTEDDVIEHIFGDVNNFANMVEEHGDEFTVGDLVVKYDPETDVHSFYYKKQGVAEIINPMTANTSGAGAGMMASYQARENQPIAEGCVVDYMEEVRS
jgi:hypothetical protein